MADPTRLANRLDSAVGSSELLGQPNPRRFEQQPYIPSQINLSPNTTCPTNPNSAYRLPRLRSAQPARTFTPLITASLLNETNFPNHHARHQFLQPRPSPPAPILQLQPRLISFAPTPARHPSTPRQPGPPSTSASSVSSSQPARSSTSPTAYLTGPTHPACQPFPQQPAPPPMPAPTPAEKTTSSSHLAFSLTVILQNIVDSGAL